MRSKIARRILNETPEDVKIFVRWYGDIVVLVHQLMEEKGYSKKELARKLDKRPSEISKWLNGEHNFTLKSLAKLQAQLDEPIIYIPKRRSFQKIKGQSFSMTVYRNMDVSKSKKFTKGSFDKLPRQNQVA